MAAELPNLHETRLGLSYVRERLERRKKELLEQVATLDADMARIDAADLLLVSK